MSEGLLVRSSLGQIVKLGALYNASRDAISENHLLENIADEAIEIEEKIEKHFERTQLDSLEEKFAKFGVSADQGASFLSGLCKTRGSGAYLAHTKLSNNIQQASGICTVKTKSASLSLTEEALGSSVNMDNLDAAPDATHVVVGIQYGAKAVVSFRERTPAATTTSSSGQDSSEKLSHLLEHIGRLFSPLSPDTSADESNEPNGSTESNGTKESNEPSDSNKINGTNGDAAVDFTTLAASYDLKLNSDVVVKGLKTVTFSGICQFAEKFIATVEAPAATADIALLPCLSFNLMPIKDFLTELNHTVPETLPSYAPLEEKDVKKVLEIFEHASSSRRDLNDHFASCKAHPECVPEAYVDKIKKRTVDKYEKDLASTMSEALNRARSNTEDVSEVKGAIETYTTTKLAPSKQTSDLKDYTTKIEFFDQAKAAGAQIVNLASIDQIDEIVAAAGVDSQTDAKRDVYVFYFTAASTSLALWEKNKKQIFEVLSNNRGCAVALVDLDMGTKPSKLKVAAPCIQLRRGGKVVLPDVIADMLELADKCLIRCDPASPGPTRPARPVPLEKRRPVMIACPNAGCPVTESMWICPKCKEQITFGFKVHKSKDDKTGDTPEDNLYCNCGVYDLGLAEFKCKNKPYHAEYVKYPGGRPKFRELLLTMKPFEQFNILLLGETGCGKSTFINGFVNYLLYDSLQDALDAENLTFAVPGYFRFADPNIAGREIGVSFGAENSTEQLSTSGQSATQSTVSYVINVNGRLIRLMDTPGLGDTRGLDQDYKNVADIMQTLESVDNLSAIMFLVKNNQARLTASFDFVLSELMNHLHKDTAKNIIYGFTYGSSSNFQIGEAKVPLTRLLIKRNLPTQELISDKNAFVFDAEGFRFVAAWQKEQIEMPNKEFISNSWRKSAEQVRMMVNVVMDLKVHDVKQTLSLERNRRLVAGMSQNMVNLTRAINKTRSDLTAQLTQIDELKKKGDLAKAKLTYTKTSLVQNKLGYPRTVCCAPGCAENKTDPSSGMATLVFVKSCHDNCGISTPESTYGLRELGECMCFAEAGADCNVCGHGFAMHCHISYVQVFVTETLTNQTALDETNDVKTQEEKAEQFITAQRALVAALDVEERTIKSALARFSIYLAANSITAVNDGVIDYLDQLIAVVKNTNKQQYEDYRLQKERHELLIKEMREAIKDNKEQVPDDNEIDRIFVELQNLKEYGKSFSGLLIQKEIALETTIATPVNVAKTGSWKKMGAWMPWRKRA